jgi:hypothetical protein
MLGSMEALALSSGYIRVLLGLVIFAKKAAASFTSDRGLHAVSLAGQSLVHRHPPCCQCSLGLSTRKQHGAVGCNISSWIATGEHCSANRLNNGKSIQSKLTAAHSTALIVPGTENSSEQCCPRNSYGNSNSSCGRIKKGGNSEEYPTFISSSTVLQYFGGSSFIGSSTRCASNRPIAPST